MEEEVEEEEQSWVCGLGGGDSMERDGDWRQHGDSMERDGMGQSWVCGLGGGDSMERDGDWRQHGEHGEGWDGAELRSVVWGVETAWRQHGEGGVRMGWGRTGMLCFHRWF